MKLMKITTITLIVILGMMCTSAIAKEYIIGQKNKTFVDESGKNIENILLNVGDKIHFQNQDPWLHNVFSVSEEKNFDLGSYPKGESKEVLFDTKGEVEVECAIHPEMFMLVKIK